MKNFIIVSAILFSINLFSQQSSGKNDIIMTKDGQLLQVEVTKVTEDTISFHYPGEGAVNEIKSNGVGKIVFASGRTQNFDGSVPNTSAPSDSSSTKESSVQPKEIITTPNYEENTMAIVPLKFTRNSTYDKTLSNDATDYVTSLVSKSAEAKGITILEKGKVIEKLVDAGVNYDKLRQSSPEELRDVLGTEYLLYVTLDEKEKNIDTTNLDYMDEATKTNTSENIQLARNIGLKLYDTDSEVESYEVDFFENVFRRESDTTNISSLTSGKWKSSLRYLTDQLFTSDVFSN